MLKKSNDNRGSALVMVISMMFIVTILIFALVSLVISEFKLVNSEEDSQQAYYLARSGAAATADWIEKQDFQTVLDTFGGDNGQTTNWQHLEEDRPGEFKVKVQIYEKIEEEIKKYSLVIESKGRFDGKERTVKLTMKNKNVAVSNLNTSIFSESTISVGNKSVINDDIGSNFKNGNPLIIQDNKNQTNINGNLLVSPDMKEEIINKIENNILSEGKVVTKMDTDKENPLPAFPVFPEINEGDENYTETFDSDKNTISYSDGALRRYGSINLEKDLNIDTGSSENNIMEIRVGNLAINNNKVYINGNGTVKLYIDKSINLDGQGVINEYSLLSEKKEESNINKLIIYYNVENPDVNKISLTGQSQIVGHIYSKNADVRLAGKANLFGHIISSGEKISIEGNALNSGGSELVRMIYAPKTEIIFNSSKNKGDLNEFTGSIVGNSVSIKNTRIGLFPIILDSLPFDFNLGKFEKDYWH